jgi:hypothetical protein
MRTLHSLTATWLNAAAASEAKGLATDAQVTRALVSYRRLRQLLEKEYRDPQLHDFVRELRSVANELREALAVFAHGHCCAPEDEFFDEGRCARPLQAEYDRACRLAFGHNPQEALEALELAVGLEDIKTFAVRDPWLEELRSPETGGEAAQRFWELVGGRAPAFVDLPLLGTKGKELRALGIVEADDLCAATACPDGVADLAKSLEVATCVVQGWVGLAELAVLAGSGPHPGDSRAITLLAAVGVRRPEELRDAELEPLLAALEKAARTHDVRPLTEKQITAWRSAVPHPDAPVPPDLQGSSAAGGRGWGLMTLLRDFYDSP